MVCIILFFEIFDFSGFYTDKNHPEVPLIYYLEPRGTGQARRELAVRLVNTGPLPVGGLFR